MDTLVLLLLSLALSFVLKITFSPKKESRLPPGPPWIPVIGSIVLLGKSLFDLETTLRRLHSIYGPIVTLRISTRRAIFIADRALAHQALVQHGAAFADRAPPLPHDRILGSNQHNINTAAYGPTWRILRRNLASEVLHPSRLKLFSAGRSWVRTSLSGALRARQAEAGNGGIVPIEMFHDAMFFLLVLMCFGDKVDDKTVKDIEDIQRYLLVTFEKFAIFGFLPPVTKLVFRKRWSDLLAIRKKQDDVFIPLIRARRDRKRQGNESGEQSFLVYSYVDSLLGLQIPEDGGRKLSEGEMVSLCSEFLAAGTDTTSTALQWVMARLVKHQDTQEKLLAEIRSAVGSEVGEVSEEDVLRMPYLKAVILEALRLHSPAHFLLPHAVTEEMELEGYTIPKDAAINFMVVEMNRDGRVWEEPMEFRPERFLPGGSGEGVDITGNREIKMMPFGAGRRICPGMGLAMLHLEYFVANLVREFEWRAVEGEEVDMAEKLEFTVVMKSPLRACVSPRMG